jgi:hypothetical protein
LTPSEEDIARWSARLRAALPGWGVFYDPVWGLWVGVRGRDALIVATTPAKLAYRATRHSRHSR